jgi:hypothetical protein
VFPWLDGVPMPESTTSSTCHVQLAIVRGAESTTSSTCHIQLAIVRSAEYIHARSVSEHLCHVWAAVLAAVLAASTCDVWMAVFGGGHLCHIWMAVPSTEAVSKAKKGRGGGTRAKATGEKVVDFYYNMMQGFEAVDALVKDCEDKDKLIAQGMRKWGGFPSSEVRV